MENYQAHYEDENWLPPVDYDETKVPPEIKFRSKGVREASWGWQNKEFLAQGLEIAGIVSEEAKQVSEETKIRQDNLEQYNDQMIVEMTDKDVISAPEIIASRGGKATLGARLDEIKTQGLIPVTHFGVVGDGVTDDAPSLQEYVEKMESDGLPYMYFPTFEQNYYVNDSIKIHAPDVRIFGDKGIQLNHPSDVPLKKGNILIGSNATTGLDLGEYRRNPQSGVSPASRNPSGSWVVEGLSFRPFNDEFGLRNGIELTSMQNGPDRIYLLSKLSFNNLNNAIYMPPAPSGVSIMAANLNIENISAYGNKRGIFIEGPVFGATIKNNNLENNTEGSVWGNFNDAVSINHNMLELVKNPVQIFGNDYVNLESKGNYFEYHPTSDYLYKINTGSYYRHSSVNIHDNIDSGGINMEYPVILTGSAYTKVNSPQFKVLLEDPRMKVKKGSTLLSDNGGYYAINKLTTSGTAIYMDEGFKRTDTNNEWVHDYPTTNTFEEDTPLGRMNVSDLADGFTINQPLTTGGHKLIIINLMVKTDPTKSLSGDLNLNSNSGVYMGGIIQGKTTIREISQGEWTMISMPFIINKSSTRIDIKLPEEDRGKVFVAGSTSKNFGSYDSSIDDIKKIYPVAPKTQDATGTFTPQIGNATDAVYSYQEQKGSYKRVGNEVFFDVYIKANVTHNGGTAVFMVTPLPFWAKSSQIKSFSGGIVGYNSDTFTQVIPRLNTNRYVERIEFIGLGTTNRDVRISDIKQGTVEVFVSGSYKVN